LFGLNPYSSISFFRCSSALFRAFLFFQKNKSPTTSNAMATIGTTTATAIFPPCDKPPEAPGLSTLFVVRGAAPEEEEDDVEIEDSVNEDAGWGVGLAVDVTTTTEGVPVPPVDAGLSVMTEVIRTIELVGGDAAVIDGTGELGRGTAEEAAVMEELIGGMKEEPGWSWEALAGAEDVAASGRLISTKNRHDHKCTHQ
jgi:hypothetical protein